MTDNHCEFGRWLYEDFPKSESTLSIFEQVREIHAAFHQNAAHILRLALEGDRDTALETLSIQSEFMTLSGRLILMLRDLRDT